MIPFPTPGTTLTSSRGKYVVGALIGDGQYGSVYECVGPFDQAYALKMLRPANKAYQAVKDEWSHEMIRLESVRHPNIVYIHDAVEDNFLFYFALGLLLSYVTWRTGGLEAAVAIHVANNMIGMAFVPFQDLGTVMDRSAGVGSPVVLLQFAAAAVAVAIIVWLSGRWGVARTGPRVILGAAR